MALAYDESPRASEPQREAAASASEAGSPVTKAPRTDAGTIVLHWIFAAAVTASLLTGLRIAADERDAVFAKFLSPILPQGEIWTWHFASSMAMFIFATAYVLYIARARLAKRIAPARLAVLTLNAPTRLRWNAVNVALHWLIYAILITQTASGIFLYAGHGSWIVTLHRTLAFVTLGYIGVHVSAHFMYGGLGQLLRLFRVAPIPAEIRRKQPLLLGTMAGVLIAFAATIFDFATRDHLHVGFVSRAPKLDGVLDDTAWQTARPVYIRTMEGANLGGTGESLVEMRAVQDQDRIYFAFRWEDPSRSLRRLPIIKLEDGWHMTGHDAGSADVVDFYEDKFAVIFSDRDDFGSGGVSHLGPRPVADKPPSLNDRGLHYTTDGAIIDMWQWKSSRGGTLGLMDDMYIGPIQDPTPDQAARKARYQGGYWPDPGHGIYTYNFPFDGPGGYQKSFEPQRLPKDLKALQKSMGKFDMGDPDASVEEGSIWWLDDENSLPYTKELDASIPVGTILPGVVLSGTNEGDRGDLKTGAKWEDGHWTLEVSRKLHTGSKYDEDFVPGKPIYVWVSVFDHTQTRHTRHARPIVLSLDG